MASEGYVVLGGVLVMALYVALTIYRDKRSKHPHNKK